MTACSAAAFSHRTDVKRHLVRQTAARSSAGLSINCCTAQVTLGRDDGVAQGWFNMWLRMMGPEGWFPGWLRAKVRSCTR